MGKIITNLSKMPELTRPQVSLSRKKIGKYPSSSEWRHRNPVQIPDKGFTKQLKKLNKDYEVLWDWGSEKWEIWKFPDLGKPSHVTTIQTKNRTYRELGADILLNLQQFSFERYTAEELSNYLVELENQESRRKAKDFKNKIEAIAKDTFNFSRGVLQISVPDKIEVPASQIIGRIVANEESRVV